jgi:hypothetical protein
VASNKKATDYKKDINADEASLETIWESVKENYGQNSESSKAVNFCTVGGLIGR